jgi:hypothetical protein
MFSVLLLKAGYSKSRWYRRTTFCRPKYTSDTMWMCFSLIKTHLVLLSSVLSSTTLYQRIYSILIQIFPLEFDVGTSSCAVKIRRCWWKCNFLSRCIATSLKINCDDGTCRSSIARLTEDVYKSFLFSACVASSLLYLNFSKTYYHMGCKNCRRTTVCPPLYPDKIKDPALTTWRGYPSRRFKSTKVPTPE